MRSLAVIAALSLLTQAQSIVPVEQEPHHGVAFENAWTSWRLNRRTARPVRRGDNRRTWSYVCSNRG